MANIRVNDDTKRKFDELVEAMKGENVDATQDAVTSAAVDALNAKRAEVTFTPYELDGMAEVMKCMTDAYEEMHHVLVRRKRDEEGAVSELSAKVEELAATLSEHEATIAERDQTISEQAAELEDLRVKAASVDALTEAMREAEEAASKREEAQAKRFDDVMAMLKAQIERYESELDDAKAKVSEVEAERDALAEQVKQLQARLTEVEQAGKE